MILIYLFLLIFYQIPFLTLKIIEDYFDVINVLSDTYHLLC